MSSWHPPCTPSQICSSILRTNRRECNVNHTIAPQIKRLLGQTYHVSSLSLCFGIIAFLNLAFSIWIIWPSPTSPPCRFCIIKLFLDYRNSSVYCSICIWVAPGVTLLAQSWRRHLIKMFICTSKSLCFVLEWLIQIFWSEAHQCITQSARLQFREVDGSTQLLWMGTAAYKRSPLFFWGDCKSQLSFHILNKTNLWSLTLLQVPPSFLFMVSQAGFYISEKLSHSGNAGLKAVMDGLCSNRYVNWREDPIHLKSFLYFSFRRVNIIAVQIVEYIFWRLNVKVILRD